MSIKCISLGQINKYIFLVLLAPIIYFCILIIESNSKYFKSSAQKNKYPIVYLIIYSFGLCLSIILLLINKIYSKSKKSKTFSQENIQYLSNLTRIKRVSKKEKYLWLN